MAATRRTRRIPSGSGAIDELKVVVDSLIKENKNLKRQLARLETKTVGRASTAATRGLTTIKRRLERALGSTSSGRSRRASSTARRPRRSSATVAKARRPASPETKAKRLAALARARAVRAAQTTEKTS
jgi:hypothetical protein